MTLMSSKYSCQKTYSEAIFFRISDCAKNVVGYTASKCHNRISETLSRFCYNALTNPYIPIYYIFPTANN
jgi:hypothetical protein